MTRWASEFDASFVCTPAPEGTTATRTLTFRFRPYLRFMERVLRRSMTDDVREEMQLAKAHLEGSSKR